MFYYYYYYFFAFELIGQWRTDKISLDRDWEVGPAKDAQDQSRTQVRQQVAPYVGTL